MPAAAQAAFLTVPGPCDLACVFCVSHRREAPERDAEAELAFLRAEIDRQAAAGVKEIVWGNGDHEPTAFPHLAQVLAHASARGILRQALVTNGLRASEPRLLESLVEAGLHEVRLSLFGWDAASADLFCDGEGVAAAKQRLMRHCQTLGLEVAPTVLLMRCNYLRLGEILDLYAESVPEGQQITLFPIWSTQPGLDSLFLPPLSGVYREARAAALARPELELLLSNLPECLREGQPAPPPNLELIWSATDRTLAPCPDCPGGERCAGLPPGYDEVHADRRNPSLAPLDAPLELERLVEELRVPNLDSPVAVARVLGLPPPPPFKETDPAKLSGDPSSAFYGMEHGAILAALEEETLAESDPTEGRVNPTKLGRPPRPSLARRLRRFLFPPADEKR